VLHLMKAVMVAIVFVGFAMAGVISAGSGNAPDLAIQHVTVAAASSSSGTPWG
jgi:hypothetical protein